MTDYLVITIQERNIMFYRIAGEDEKDAIDKVAATELYNAISATAIYGGGYFAVEYEKAAKYIDLANIIIRPKKLTNPMSKFFQ